MKVLVTGGAGFIGANLCRRLVAQDGITSVVVLDDFSSGKRDNLVGISGNAPLEVRQGSITEPDRLHEAMDGCEAVVHLAAVPSVPRSIAHPLRSHEANATGTLHVLDVARQHGAPHVVLASSSSVYGSNPAQPKTEDLQCRPMSPYAVSKLATEQYAVAYAQCYGLKVLPFRFFNVYGPLQAAGHAYAAVVPAFLEAALAGEAVPINGDGNQTRDFTFVATVAEVITQAVLRQVTSGPVNLAYGTRTSLLEVVEMLEGLLGRPLKIDYRPERPGDVRHSQADNNQLRGMFPEVGPTPLVEGLAATAAWFTSRA